MATWTEPALRSARWGSYRVRYGAGLGLVVLGISVTVLSSTYSLWALLLGPLVHALGWLVLPGALWRRLLVLIPCALGALALLSGPDFAGGFVVLVAGWLLVRHRPPASYAALLLPVAAAVASRELLSEYSDNWLMLLMCGAASVGAAWLGRWLATLRLMPSQFHRGLR